MSGIRSLLLGEEHPWVFLLECALRSALMFVFALGLMKVTGKKEVRQFSILELMVIIGLGSALGDPMINKDSPLLPSLVAISVVLGLYWALNRWTNASVRAERFIEGKVTRVVHEGVVDVDALKQEGMSIREFFGDLRKQHIDHTGQVKTVYVEIDGTTSVLFRADDDVRPGLPIIPERLDEPARLCTMTNVPCCCAQCAKLLPVGSNNGTCPNCGCDQGLPAVGHRRIT